MNRTAAGIDGYGLTRPQLAEVLRGHGFSPSHATRLWRYLYRDMATEAAAMPELPSRLRAWLEAHFEFRAPAIVRETQSDDGFTQKYLLGFDDAHSVETVLMRHGDRHTACISSQVGCPLGCVFCATGQAGFTRNLTTAEITAQVLHVERELRRRNNTDRLPNDDRRRTRLRNLVVMGMGEPLLNYDAAMAALDIVRDPGGLAIGVKQITVSTVGVVPGIVRWADERRPFSLAVSLHAATQDERAELVPAAFTWPLDELMQACRYYTMKLGRKIFFEWTLIAGVNDTLEQATALARLLTDIPAQVNLIPLNATAEFHGEPGTAASVTRFLATLADHHIAVSIRSRRGLDIAAGCGQLAGARS